VDTDDLSNESYEAIILEAEKFNHNLTLHFGVMASSCKNEDEYLLNAKKLINEIRKLDEYDLEDLFFGEKINPSNLYESLKQMELSISKVESIPKEKRHYEF
jgi:acyl-CoA hydrolase